jgi:hypothetical protein
MFDAGVPRDLGNRLAQAVDGTARELMKAADPNEIVEAHEATLRARWGDSFDAKVALVRNYVAREVARSPALKGWLTDHPELFGSPNSMTYLLQLAEHAQRRGARA